MSKREARIARDNEKRLKQAEKNARLVEIVKDIEEPRLGADPNSIFDMKMSWSRDGADRSDSWSWGTPREWTDDDWDNLIKPKLEEWSNLKWSEIDQFSSGEGHKMHHLMDTGVIVEEAQYRLIEIDRYADRIFRFRLGNKRRLWGHRIVSKFYVIWYDPKHEIYPTEPD